MLTSLTFVGPAPGAPARRRLYVTAFVALSGVFYAMAATSPQGLAELTIFLTVAQLAALTAGLVVYVQAAETPTPAPVRNVRTHPVSGKEALRESLAALLKVADKAEPELAVAVMLMEADQAEPAGRGRTHAFERIKLALRFRSGQAETIELSENCLALTLEGASASYDLEETAHSLLRDLRDLKQSEIGMTPLNLTFGIGVCSGERSSVESLVWQARVALRRAYDLSTGIYVVSNRGNLAKRV